MHDPLERDRNIYELSLLCYVELVVLLWKGAYHTYVYPIWCMYTFWDLCPKQAFQQTAYLEILEIIILRQKLSLILNWKVHDLLLHHYR